MNIAKLMLKFEISSKTSFNKKNNAFNFISKTLCSVQVSCYSMKVNLKIKKKKTVYLLTIIINRIVSVK